MANNKVPTFSEGLMRIRKLSPYKDRDCFPDLIIGINSIRKEYKWSKKVYCNNNIADVYLISSNGITFGFIECKYNDLDICSKKTPTIFLHEIHIAPSMKYKGVGKSVLKHLLKKRINLEMVVANKNKDMLTLVEKFNFEYKHIQPNTRTVLLKP